MFQYYCPVAYAYLGMEDSWGEYGTFVCYLMASCMIAWAIWVNRGYQRPGYGLFCLGLFVIAMEEISWGQRLFDVKVPYAIAQHNFQGELSVHNLYIFQDISDAFYLMIILWVFLTPVLAHNSQRIKVIFNKIGMPFVPYYLMSYFALSYAVYNAYHSGVVIAAQDISEQLFGIAFILYAVEMLHQSYEEIGRRVWNKICLRSVSALAVLVITFLFVAIKPTDIYTKRFFLDMFAKKYYPKGGLNDQAEKIFQYIINDSEIKTDESFMQYGKYLQEIHSVNSESVLLKALQEQKERMELQPDRSKPHYLAGKILRLLNREKQAKEEFELAIMKGQNLLPNAPSNWEKVDTLKSIGEAYLEIGQDRMALQYFQRAEEIVNDGWQKGVIRSLIKNIGKE